MRMAKKIFGSKQAGTSNVGKFHIEMAGYAEEVLRELKTKSNRQEACDKEEISVVKKVTISTVE
jgi:hypothetical protein